MNMVIFSVYDYCNDCSAILITDLNAKSFKRVEADNACFRAAAFDTCGKYQIREPFILFDFLEKFFDERVDRILHLEDGAYVEDLIKTCGDSCNSTDNIHIVTETITDNKGKIIATRKTNITENER